MENKEIRKNAAELNDEALENVNGGLLVPFILDDEDETRTGICAMCGSITAMRKQTYEYRLVNGVYYCDECKAKLM